MRVFMVGLFVLLSWLRNKISINKNKQIYFFSLFFYIDILFSKPLKRKFYSESSHAVATCKLIGDFWLLRGVFVVTGLEVSGIDGYFVIYLILCTETV